MQPRIVFRTHYQVDEPAYMEFLVKRCTSPVQSVYPEVVAQRLAQEINARGKEFNSAAGRYAVDLATALNLITANNTWTDKGQLIDLIAEVGDGDLEEELLLTPRERLLHFRIFLEADGGAFLYLAHRLAEGGSLPGPSPGWNELSRDMFVAVYSDYLAITNNTAERVALRREIDRIKAKGYEGKTGPHKLFIHLQTLYRLGLVVRPECGTSRVYQVPSTSTETGIHVILSELPDVFALERALKQRSCIDIAVKVLQIPSVPYVPVHDSATGEDILSLVVPFYLRLARQGVPLCPLPTLIEAAQIDLLASTSQLMAYEQGVKLTTNAQKTFPKDVRFHVDRRGQPAFLKLSNNMLNRFGPRKVPE